MSQNLQAAAAALIPELLKETKATNDKLDTILDILTAPPVEGKPAKSRAEESSEKKK